MAFLTQNLPILAFLFLHLPLALLLHRNPILSTLHAVGTIAIGIGCLSRDRHPFRVLYVIAYICGAELLWRATGSYTFYELGKYATALLMIGAILKFNLIKKIDVRGLLYFGLLLPSLLQLPSFDRESIAFNLSGPFSLAVAIMFFGAVQVPRAEIPRFCLALLAPILSLVSLSTFTTMTYSPGVFIIGSRNTSGGVGPNQMSAMLGLGFLVAFLLLFIRRNHTSLRLVLMGCVLWFAGQCALTFSRGGFWSALAALTVAALYLFTGRKVRGGILALGTLIFLLFNFFVFPALDSYTGGLLTERFSNFDTTGRDKIAQADLLIFQENPVFGIGPGGSRTLHDLTFGVASAHTEFSRLLAEHGSLGVLAILVLLSLVWQRFRGAQPPLERACFMSFAAWGLLFMAHAAMRLVVPSVLFGLGSVTLAMEPAAHPARRPLGRRPGRYPARAPLRPPRVRPV